MPGFGARSRKGVRTGHNVRELANLDAYAEFERHPNAARAFNRAMGSLTHPVALALRDRVAFRGDETVVDVGGGAGHLIAPLLAGFPRMRGIVFDLAHARAQAEEVLASQGLGDRCQFISGSFFDDVPRGADVVLLKSVLHNWDDAHARRILDACRAGMPPGSRLLVIERILAGRIGRTAMDRENARSDLQMLLACDGRERDERAFRSLLGTAGFRVGTITPLTPLVAAIEAHVAG